MLNILYCVNVDNFHSLILYGSNLGPLQLKGRMKILVVGDSEAAAFKGAGHILNVEFELEVV
ncbi:hypothetical protein Avbf_11773 [Armadillidium vulgare]|nr:hypothetical protein Avbf_11773 [Armadillidium vulgare]